MTLTEAKKLINDYAYKSVLTDEEEFLLLEAYDYMIRTTGETRWMVELGGYHYEKRDFDLALKYYEMADEAGDKWAPEGLGYIWYYGRTGEKDYDKAFKYYSKAAKNGRLQSQIKVADMYKNGYGVEQDYDKYTKIIEEAYDKVKNARWLNDPLPEVFTRLAKIRTKQGRTDEAIDLYLDAKDFQIQRIAANPFFGDLNIMKWLEEDLSELQPIDRADFDLYDLYVLLKEPLKVGFLYLGEEYQVESVAEEDGISVRFGDRWFRSIDDFFGKAVIGEERVPCLYRDFYAFKVV